MYDRETMALMAAAPALSGLDPEALPQLLTRAYAELVTLRLRLSEGRLSLRDADAQLANVRRMANAYEVIAATATAEERRAAAFVSASAHHLMYRLQKLSPRQTTASYLSPGEVSAVIAGVLLYLAAGYQSDASELAAALPSEPEGGAPAAILIRNIRRLARADLITIVRSAAAEPRTEGSLHDEAVDALWIRINDGVVQLAREVLTADRPAPESSAVGLIEAARNAAVFSLPDVAAEFKRIRRVLSAYAGPHHLAHLLLLAAQELGASALVGVPPPTGAPEHGWGEFLKGLALTRPFLWKNHRQAIASGYLDAGRSAVISFPTGAGKSTLSELKIAATLLGGGKTVFLAPTRALVWQVARDLERTFATEVRDTLADDGAYDESLLLGGGRITVMTPERCLTLLSSSADLFADVRLLVFDECHLLHGSRFNSSRRSLDAMLSLLGVLEIAPAADVLLLSAMVANGAAMAAWLQELTSRPCSALDVNWKPTRQVRGCLVYPEREVSALRTRVLAARRVRETKHPSAELRKSATLTPLGLFSLQQQWHSEPDSTSYCLTKLRDRPVRLAIGQRWNVTANKNDVAAILASDLARVGVKTIVLLQDKDACTWVAAKIGSTMADAGLGAGLALSRDEQELVEAAADDLGGEDLVLGPLQGGMSVHHGLLLLPERRLNESVFARADGVPVIVATPTLAQGMNLPAEAVLIVGDMRFDTAAGERVGMAAHELLNAAGRAGRAGHFASGFVLVVPDTPITASPDFRISAGWGELQQRVFGRQDQCLTIEDPVELLLDRIQDGDPIQDPHVRYFLTRMPVHEADGDADDSARRLLQRSMGAFFARQNGLATSFSQRVDAALLAQADACRLLSDDTAA